MNNFDELRKKLVKNLKKKGYIQSEQVENAVIVSIICDRGDRYLSTGLFAE